MTLAEAVPAPEAAPPPVVVEAGRRRRLPAALTGAGAGSVAASAAALVATLGTGVLLARVLGPTGRGEATAVITAPQLVGWLFLLGSTQTISYFRAREPDRAGALLGTWLALTIPLALVAIVVGELVLGPLLGAQSPEVVALARAFMLTAGLVLLLETTLGFVLGAEHFGLFNLLKGGTPLVTAAAYIVAWRLDALTVTVAVWATAAVQGTSVVAVLVLLVRRHGIARPDRALARRTLVYGIKAHGTNASFLLNARLDLLLLPAVVPAAALGLYSVATNVSWIVFALAGALAPLVLPVAARQVEAGAGPAIILRCVRATLGLALALALVIALVARPLIEAVFGPAFGPAAPVVEVLLPGTVLYATSLVLTSGLYAAGRPLWATVAQLLGLVVTVGGLALFLGGGGIRAAAWVSCASYLVVFATALIAYLRVTGTPLLALVAPRRAGA